MSAPAALTPVDEHLGLIMATVAPLEPLELTLGEAHSALLARDVLSPLAVPWFDNSSMDGYAVRLADVAGASPQRPVLLPVVADIAAGSTADIRLQPGLCVRIMTGAPVPPGADAVVPLEWTDGGLTRVAIAYPPQLGSFIRRAGEDLVPGALVLAAGTRLGAVQLGLLASAGQARVLVQPRPRVVVISTGSELADPGEQLRVGQVYDANSIALAAACRESGATPYTVGVVPDDPGLLRQVLEDHLIQADAVITSGGVSVGAYDVVKEVLAGLGTMFFRRVAMQPGMPQGFGTIGPDFTPLFALPGNPVSALVSFEVFVRPALRRMRGAPDEAPPQVPAALTAALSSPAGKRQFVRVTLAYDATGYHATPIGGPGSHLLASFARAHALLVVPEALTDVPAGTVLPALLLDRRAS